MKMMYIKYVYFWKQALQECIQRVHMQCHYRLCTFRKRVRNCGMYLWKLGKKVHHISFVLGKERHTNMFLKVMVNFIWFGLYSVRRSRAGESSWHLTPFTHDPAEAPQKLDTIYEFWGQCPLYLSSFRTYNIKAKEPQCIQATRASKVRQGIFFAFFSVFPSKQWLRVDKRREHKAKRRHVAHLLEVTQSLNDHTGYCGLRSRERGPHA